MKKSILAKVAATAGATGMALLPQIAHATDYEYSTDYGTTAASSTAAAGVVGVILVFWIIALVIGLALFIFWIIMLIDAFKRTNWQDDSQKNLWLILLIVSIFVGLSGLAAILYYFIIKRALDKGSKPAAPAAPAAEAPAEKK